MDIISLRDLKIQTLIGVFDRERQLKQTIVLNIDFGIDCKDAAESENIKQTTNYHTVTQRLIQYVEESTCQLIETLAENISHVLLTEFHIPWVKVTLSKPGVMRELREVSITIERGAKVAS